MNIMHTRRDPELQDLLDKWNSMPVGPWKWVGDNLENNHGDTILRISASSEFADDATVRVDFGYGVQDFLARVRSDISELFDLVDQANDEKEEDACKHDSEQDEWERDRENLDYKIKKLREVLLLVFRDTHAAGTLDFNRDTVGMYTAEKIREVLGIDAKWLERDLAYGRDRAAASDSAMDAGKGDDDGR